MSNNITLLDFYAAQVLPYCVENREDTTDFDGACHEAYEIAIAMMNVRWRSIRQGYFNDNGNIA